MSQAAFATAAIALYVGHHVGDYWVQTDGQARHKGDAGAEGVIACALHTATYLLTQVMFLSVTAAVTGWRWHFWAFVVALAISAGTHYTADRREYGAMFWLARRLPGKAAFLELGRPRAGREDNPSLGTGAWALDQSWHLAFSVFVPALVLSL